MSRQERQALRLRGAGRTFVDTAPIAFKSRLITNTNVSSGDARVPLADMNSNKTINRTTKTSGKLMDFRTPKMVKTAKAKTPIRSPSRSIACVSVETPEASLPIESAADVRLCSPLQSSTPSALLHEPHQEPVSPFMATCGTPSERFVDVPSLKTMDTGGDSMRKRKSDTMDLAVPVNMSPVKTKKRKLRGLLRELGPGASRFVIGAPNFATPARRRSIAFTKVVLGRVQRGARRTSGRLMIGDLQDTIAPRASRAALPKRSKVSSASKVVKLCSKCDGSRAWNRWHALENGLWSCHKCYKKPKQLKNGSEHAVQARRRGRVGQILTEEELILVLARRQQGRTFDSIAKELKKWKTGQSVKNYLLKHTTPGDEDRLAAEIARCITSKQ